MRFSMALTSLKQKYKLPGSTHYAIIGEAIGPEYRNRKMRLALPPGLEIEKMLEKHVAPMFKRVQEEQLTTASIAIDEPGVKVTVRYDADQRYGGGSYPSYTAAYSVTRNPVYTSLKAKVRQLKKARTAGAFGIFLCDGGCALLKNKQRHPETVSLDQVVHDFFRQNSSLSFVVVLVIPPTSSTAFADAVRRLRINGDVYVNPRAKHALDSAALLTLINRALAHLPPPIAKP
jgi:hypothetical protein